MALERRHRRELAEPDELGAGLEDAPMQLLAKMLWLQKVRDAVEGVVVDEERAEQRLLGLDIVRRDARGGSATE